MQSKKDKAIAIKGKELHGHIKNGYKVVESDTGKNQARKGVIGMKELGLTLKDTKGLIPVFVPVKNPSDVELIGFSKNMKESRKLYDKFEKVMEVSPNTTFSSFRKSQRGR